jgi:hypothetical protein
VFNTRFFSFFENSIQYKYHEICRHITYLALPVSIVFSFLFFLEEYSIQVDHEIYKHVYLALPISIVIKYFEISDLPIFCSFFLLHDLFIFRCESMSNEFSVCLHFR